jgi:2-isopropylmalate synthase
LGKHSGRAALAARAQKLGYRLTNEQLDALFQDFKRLADKKKEIYDGDLIALIEFQMQTVAETYTLEHYEVSTGTGKTPHVRMVLRKGEEVLETELSAGDGPVDASSMPSKN